MTINWVQVAVFICLVYRAKCGGARAMREYQGDNLALWVSFVFGSLGGLLLFFCRLGILASGNMDCRVYRMTLLYTQGIHLSKI